MGQLPFRYFRSFPPTARNVGKGIDADGLHHLEVETASDLPMNDPPPPLEQLISISDAAKRLAVSERTLRNWGDARTHGFPATVRLGARKVAFVERELVEWVRSRNEARSE